MTVTKQTNSDMTNTSSTAKKKRGVRKPYVKRACTNCRNAHAACDSNRPCKRCVQLGLDDCVDGERKKPVRKTPRKKKNQPEMNEGGSAVVLNTPAASNTDSNCTTFYPPMTDYIPFMAAHPTFAAGPTVESPTDDTTNTTVAMYTAPPIPLFVPPSVHQSIPIAQFPYSQQAIPLPHYASGYYENEVMPSNSSSNSMQDVHQVEEIMHEQPQHLDAPTTSFEDISHASPTSEDLAVPQVLFGDLPHSPTPSTPQFDLFVDNDDAEQRKRAPTPSILYEDVLGDLNDSSIINLITRDASALESGDMQFDYRSPTTTATTSATNSKDYVSSLMDMFQKDNSARGRSQNNLNDILSFLNESALSHESTHHGPAILASGMTTDNQLTTTGEDNGRKKGLTIHQLESLLRVMLHMQQNQHQEIRSLREVVVQLQDQVKKLQSEKQQSS